MASRILFLDNTKGILIFLVVLGHFLLPVNSGNQIANNIFNLIYLFHMPLFVFITGFFAKSIFKNNSLRIDKIISTFVLAMLFQLVLILMENPSKPLSNTLFSFSSAPWYLVSLCFWYLIVPFLKRAKPLPAIIFSFIISIGSGCLDQLGSFLSLARTFSFLPYFVMGFYCTKANLEALRTRTIGRICVFLSIAFIVWYCFYGSTMTDMMYLMYGSNHYRSGNMLGMFQHCLLVCIAVVLSIALLQIASSRHTFFCIWGERTLQIYVLHRIIRGLFVLSGFYNFALISSCLGTLIILGLSAVLTAILSSAPLKVPFDRIMGIKWKFFCIQENKASNKKTSD